MRVRATKLGYYDHKRRKEGDVFELKDIKGLKQMPNSKKTEPIVYKAEDQFSSTWMELVDGEEKKNDDNYEKKPVKKKSSPVEVLDDEVL